MKEKEYWKWFGISMVIMLGSAFINWFWIHSWILVVSLWLGFVIAVIATAKYVKTWIEEMKRGEGMYMD